MLRTWFVVAALVVACGGGNKPAPAEPVVENKQPETTAPAPTPQTPMERVRFAMESFMNEMCACGSNNANCAKEVSDRMTAWSQEEARKSEEPPKMTEEDQKWFTQIGTQMGECMQNAMSSPTP